MHLKLTQSHKFIDRQYYRAIGYTVPILIVKFYFQNTQKIFRRSSIGTFIRPNSSEGTQPKLVKPQPKLDYRSMISVDDMPELFVNIDSEYHLYSI